MFSLDGIGKKGWRMREEAIALLLASILPLQSVGQTATDLPDPRIPIRAIGSLTDDNWSNPHDEILLRGVLTYSSGTTGLAQRLFIQDQTGAIEVAAQDATQFGVGDEIEVQGTVEPNHTPLLFRANHLRLLWTGSDAVPFALHAAQAIEGDFNARLVEVEGKLLQHSIADGTLTLVLEEENQFFVAKLAVGNLNTKEFLPNLEPGAILHLRGICSSASTGQVSPTGFTILLRSLGDIRTVRPASWFNMLHLLELTPVLLLLILFLHRLHIRNLNLRFRAVMAERSRIAREIHDTMAQDFSGVTLQLEGAVDMLRIQVPAPESLQDLEMALRLARHCREQAHDSIIVLRALSLPSSSLLDTLTQAAGLKACGRNLSIQSSSSGTPYPIRDEITHQILRIGQEAIANTLHHADATQIIMNLNYSSAGINLEIRDNGMGFIVDKAASIQEGHFGIAGMRERAASIGATLQLESALGLGTTVTLRVPRKTACPPEREWLKFLRSIRFGRFLNPLRVKFNAHASDYS